MGAEVNVAYSYFINKVRYPASMRGNIVLEMLYIRASWEIV